MKRTVLIAASGTGGHLLPALYIAQAMQHLDKDIDIQFVGSGRPLEEKIIGKAGYPLHVLPVVGLRNRGIKGFFEFIVSIPKAFLEVQRLFKKVNPSLVVGVGGYVSVFPILWSKVLGKTSWIHEAEVRPGWANWFLSFFTDKISTAFLESTVPCRSKVIYTGHPLRPGLIKARSETALNHDPRKILITGGSQGAQSLDEQVPQVLKDLNVPELEIFHQCRADNEQRVKDRYQQFGQNARVAPFIQSIEEVYAWCDLIISRSGAGALREFEVVNKPVIFVPLPYSAEQHDNAARLASHGKAVIVEEGVRFSEQLKTELLQLLDQSHYNHVKQLPYPCPRLDAASVIAQKSLELIK